MTDGNILQLELYARQYHYVNFIYSNGAIWTLSEYTTFSFKNAKAETFEILVPFEQIVGACAINWGLV